MAHFRIHFLGQDGRIDQRFDLDCPDQEAAVELAEEFAGAAPLELWQDAVRLKSIQAQN